MSAQLYQNKSATATLLDIPRSIAFAQGTSDSSRDGTLFSSPPLGVPWPSTEPVSEKAKANVASRGMARSRPTAEEQMLKVLDELKTVWKSEWCLERQLKPNCEEPELSTPTRSLTGWKLLEPLLLKENPTEPLLLQDILSRPVSNPAPRSTSLRVIADLEHGLKPSRLHSNSVCYRVPPSSTFNLSSIGFEDTGAFCMGALSLLPDHSSTTSAGPGEFNFILLDPPWSNRSARRSKSYETCNEPMEALKSILGQHVASRGIVACWITNSSVSQEAAMQAFEAWDVQLVEEWYWLKVTRDGQPVTDIHGVWRKPYETLLVGRKIAQREPEDDPIRTHSDSDSDMRPLELKRRVIVAVPDVHSRKPCLKQLVEQAFGFEEGKYRALEIFARNLTAGWWAWGDECLKFQWDGWWVDGSSNDGEKDVVEDE